MDRLTYTILDIAEIVTENTLLRNEHDAIRYLIYDSRKINDPKHSLFFALKGNKDGHEFINLVYSLGVRNFVVKEGFVPGVSYQDANFLFVKDTLTALQALAMHHRQQFDYPVIAITGSNGKTVVKEWLNQLLAADFNIVRSPKSYNSQIGVALSLWQLGADNNLAIIEAGISKVGEMDKLREMIQPTIGVLTNIGPAHDDGFKNTEEKLLEKLKLFKDVDRLIYSPKYIPTSELISGNPQLFTWSFDADTNLEVLRKVQNGGFLTIYAKYKDEELSIEIPFNDEAAVENAIICWSVMLSMNYSQEVIQKRMKALLSVEMRLQLKNGINNCSVIDDSYSCDIASLTIALNFLQQQNQHKKRTLILSDIPGNDKDKGSIYETVALLLKSNSIEGFIGIGKDISSFSHLFYKDALFYNSTEDFIKALPGMNFHDETILLKGARSFYFEKISKLLTLKTHDTSLEINLNALEYNLNYYKRKLDNQTKLMVMVKAFSYGSGSFEIANLLQFNRVDYLAVAYPDEGIALRVSGIKSPIMVMSPDLLSFEAIIDNYLEPEIFSLDLLRSLIGLLEDRGIKEYPIHIKIETGMHRLGFEAQDFNELVEIVSTNNSVKIASVFSHLAGSGSPKHDDFTREQIAKLEMFTSELKKILPYSFLVHISNTAAIERWPEARFDMVRLGIGLYGVGSLSEGSLETVATLKTSISQIKHIKKGETVGYNRNGVLEDGGTIATVKIGYADGFSRRFGNGVGKLLIQGKLVPTVGDICMDMCMVDVTDMPVKVGDEVIVFGKEPAIESLASSIGTIPYEIMTGISQRVKRIYFYE